MQPRLVAQPDLLQESVGPDDRLGLGDLPDSDGCGDDIFQRGEVREKVEVLEHHPDAPALLRYLARLRFVELAVALAVADRFAVELDSTAVEAFKVVDVAQESGFSGTSGPKQAYLLPGIHLQVGRNCLPGLAGFVLADLNGRIRVDPLEQRRQILA